jgi:hypothetical protein
MATPNETVAGSGAGEASSPVARLCSQVKAQPAKTAVMGLLVCVLLVLLLRGALRPKTASARDVVSALVPEASAAKAPPVVLPADVLLRGGLPARGMAAAPAAARWLLPRDIFAVDLRRFPKTGSKMTEGRVDAPVAELPDDATARLAEIQRQASMLRLEGTVSGPPSVAFFGGTCVAVGAEYRGFQLVKVGEHSVQVEREGVRLEVEMAE